MIGIIIEALNYQSTNTFIMKNLLLLFLIALSAASYGQDNTSVDNTTRIDFPPAFATEEKFDITTFNGSIYSQDNFVKAQIIDKLSQKTITSFLRYDAYHDIFETNSTPSETGYEYLKQGSAIEVVINDTPFIYSNFIDQEGNSKIGYLQELANLDDTTIYYRREKTVLFPEKSTNSYKLDSKGKIKDNYYYIVKRADKKAIPTKITKKNIASFFPENLQKRVAEITKAEKLKFKDSKDILTLARLLKNP